MDDRDHRPALFGWWGVALVWMAWGLINVLRLAVMPMMSWTEALRYGFPDALVWIAVTPLLVWVSRRFELRGAKRLHHLGILALVTFGVVLAHAAVDAALSTALDRLWGDGDVVWLWVFIKVLRFEFHTRLLICMLVIGFAHYQIYARRLAEQRSEADRLAAQLSQAQLSHLRSQLRPHFLFNALNSVAASLEQSPEVGRRVVRRLGELLRASLRAEEEHWIPLERELDLARAYLEIEQARFEERLRFHIEAPPQALSWPVPALILQPLVENAVRHGLAPKIEGGALRVRAHLDGPTLVLEVRDDGVGLQASNEPGGSEGSGIGLANIRDRLAALYGDDGRLRVTDRPGGGVVARLELPHRPGVAA